jgi:predicted kinase
MDLEHLGAAPLAHRFLTAYRELSGENGPSSLLHHYIAERAHVRAKVACLRGGVADRAVARRLHELARTHLRAATVRLALVGGDPGAGKSTLAAAISDGTGWALLRSDEVRKDLAGIGHQERAGTGFGTGAYRDAATAATYHELLERARALLAHGESVVLDATWADAGHRAEARRLADATTSDLVELRCVAPAAAREDRIRRRADSGSDASDATVSVARAMSARAAPWPTASVVDTAGDPACATEAALRLMGIDPLDVAQCKREEP